MLLGWWMGLVSDHMMTSFVYCIAMATIYTHCSCLCVTSTLHLSLTKGFPCSSGCICSLFTAFGSISSL